MKSDLRARLREETAGLHRKLERLIDLTSDLDEAKLVRALQVLRSPVVQLEALGPDPLPWGASCVRSSWIDEDLALYGTRSLPLGPILQVGSPRWLGAHYVHEGSALGSRIVLQRLADAGLHSTYFQRLTERIAYWPSFLGYLADVPPLQHDLVVEGACQHFDLLCQRASACQ